MTATTQKLEKSRDEIAEAYKSPAWWYDLRGFFILTFAYNSSLWHQVNLFTPNFGAHHLEVACGTGTLLDIVLRWRRFRRMPSTELVGIDYAESMLAGAHSRFKGDPTIRIQHADAAALPFPDSSFDTANCANAIHCLPDVDAALREIHRVLKPGGTFVTNVLLYPRTPWPFGAIAGRLDRWGMKKGILVTPYEPADILGRMAGAGFQVSFQQISGNCLDVVARK